MPIEDHPLFEQPPDDAKLWRYMDVPKLVSILVINPSPRIKSWTPASSFFAGAGRFGDTWEGYSFKHMK